MTDRVQGILDGVPRLPSRNILLEPGEEELDLFMFTEASSPNNPVQQRQPAKPELLGPPPAGADNLDPDDVPDIPVPPVPDRLKPRSKRE